MRYDYTIGQCIALFSLFFVYQCKKKQNTGMVIINCFYCYYHHHLFYRQRSHQRRKIKMKHINSFSLCSSFYRHVIFFPLVCIGSTIFVPSFSFLFLFRKPQSSDMYVCTYVYTCMFDLISFGFYKRCCI